MGLIKRLLGKASDGRDGDGVWEGYSVNYTDTMPNPGVYLDPDANIMRLVIEVGGATDEKARGFANSLEGVDIESVTFEGIDDDGEHISYSISTGTPSHATDGGVSEDEFGSGGER